MKSKINLKNYFCGVPFNSLEIHNNVCFVCCPSWLPNKIELSEIPLKDIYNSEPIVDIRNSILDGSFKYCNKELCPYLSKLVNYGVTSGPVNLKTDSNILTNQNIQLEKSVNNEIKNGAKLTGSVGGDPLKKEKKQDFKRDPIFTAKSSINELDLFLEKFRATEALLNKTPLVVFPGLTQKLNVVTQEFIKFNQQISDIINGSLVQTFAGIGNAIGESLATGTSLAQNLGNALLSSLGSVLGQLGQIYSLFQMRAGQRWWLLLHLFLVRVKLLWL
jgi:hypothetical protein